MLEGGGTVTLIKNKNGGNHLVTGFDCGPKCFSNMILIFLHSVSESTRGRDAGGRTLCLHCEFTPTDLRSDAVSV